MNAGARRALRVFVWTLATLAVVVLFVRAFVGDVYYVDSSSMEPVIHGAAEGGEYVFVRYDDDPRHQRFDLAIIARPQDREPLVKRIGGLPGETVRSAARSAHRQRALDRRAAAAAGRAVRQRATILLRTHAHQRALSHKARPGGSTHARCAGRRRAGTGACSTTRARPRARSEGRRRSSSKCARGTLKRLVLRLTEEGDLFEPSCPRPPAAAQLGRRPVGAKSELLGQVELSFATGVWHRLRLSNLDNRLEVDCDQRRAALRVTYDANLPLKNMPDAGYRHMLPRVAFGGGGLAADFRRIRVARDLHYTELGRHATQGSETLAPDEVFVLGDNSAESVDSREWGPVKLAHVIGRPVWVVWPPSRWRRLAAGEEISAP